MYTLGIPDRQKRSTLGYLKQRFVDFEENPSMEGFFDISFPGMDEDEFKNIVMKLKQQGVTTIGADEELTERKIMKLIDLITPMLRFMGFKQIEFNDGKQAFNFIIIVLPFRI